MKHIWNAALAAYDKELPLLRALRDEYLAYLRERLEAAAIGLPAELAERVTLEVTKAEDDDAGAELTLRGDASDTGLQVQFWSSGDVGDEPGSYVWAMLMPRSLPPEYGDAKAALRAARQASAVVPTESLEGAPTQARSYPGFELVRWGRLDLAHDEFAAKLARLVRALATGLVDTAEAVLAHRASTPAGWATATLKRLRAEGVFDREGSLHTGQGTWKPGFNVTVRVSPTDYCWFTATPDGRIGFHWESKDRAELRRQVVPGALGNPTPWKERWEGVVLVSADELARLHGAGDAEALRDRLLGTWRIYRDSYTAAT